MFESLKISLSILLFCTSVYSQKSGVVEYAIQNIDFEIKDDPNNLEAINLVKEKLKIAKAQTFTLKYNDSESQFESNTTGISGTNEREKFFATLAKISLTSEDYYYDKTNQKVIRKTTDGTLIEYKNYILDWEIFNESKKIDDYLCYKAILTIHSFNMANEPMTQYIVAWFAPSLPYSFGPKKYIGLPGLILELTEYNTTFLATKINLQNEEIKIEFPKGKRIDYNDYINGVLSK
jgi:GLPGLI family protein